jgi:hypothetical protein
MLGILETLGAIGKRLIQQFNKMLNQYFKNNYWIKNVRQLWENKKMSNQQDLKSLKCWINYPI